MRISVDIGFGFIKGVNEKGEKVCFPSVVGRKTLNMLSGLVGVQDDYIVAIEGSKSDTTTYYVGDVAITNKFERNWNNDKSFDLNLLKVFCGTCISLLGGDEKDVDLSVGLPISFFNSHRQDLKDMLQGMKIKIKVNDGEFKTFTIKSVYVFIQGAGAYYATIFNTDGDVVNYDLANSSCAIIDIGYRTVDYLVMEKGKKGINVLDNLTGSLEDEGMNVAMQEIAQALFMECGGVVDLVEVEKALLWSNGKMEYGPSIIDLRKHQEEAYSHLAEKIKNKINIQWNKTAVSIPVIYLTGGGASELYKYMHKHFKQLKVQDNGQYANAIGYLSAQARFLKNATVQAEPQGKQEK